MYWCFSKYGNKNIDNTNGKRKMISQQQDKFVLEKFEHLFDGLTPIDLKRVMVAVPSIMHRSIMTIGFYNFFPNRYIFGEETEQELYKPEIADGWQWVKQENPRNIGKIRNQILKHFRESDCGYLLMPDDDLEFREVFVQNDEFHTRTRTYIEDLLKLELARMERDSIDVLTIPNTQFLTARIINTIMNDNPEFDYSFVIYTKNALMRNNYWYENVPNVNEDYFMGKLLKADPTLKCRFAVLLRRDNFSKSHTESTLGPAEGNLFWVDRTQDLLEMLSKGGYTEDLMNLLWLPEQRPIIRYPLNHKRYKINDSRYVPGVEPYSVGLYSKYISSDFPINNSFQKFIF